jgi:hypothetical protein
MFSFAKGSVPVWLRRYQRAHPAAQADGQQDHASAEGKAPAAGGLDRHRGLSRTPVHL